VLLVLCIPAALGLAAWLLLADRREGDERASSRVPHAASPLRQAPPGPADALLTAQSPPRSAAIELEGRDAFSLRFRKPPRAGMVFDLDSGRVLWRRRPISELPIASLTKVMTAILVNDLTSSRETVKIRREAKQVGGSGVGLLPYRRRVKIEALMHGLMLPSGNDAAEALAIHAGRSEARFVKLMNVKARHMRLPCTRFVTPHGLDRSSKSCPADLAVMAQEAMRRRRIARVVRKRQAVVKFPIKNGRLWLNNTNPLLRTGYAGTIGLKTGYTVRAGRCLVGVVRREGRTLGVVLLHSPDPARQARKLLDRAFRTRS
jgi:D-alanyl-D-alanine carboxypeptidase